MLFRNPFAKFVHQKTDREAHPELNHTHWGYRLTSEDLDEGLPRLGRAIGRFVGLVLLLIIAGIWSYSAGEAADPLMLAMKLGLTCLLLVLGWLLFGFGGDISRPETQIDLNQREIRVGVSDRLGRFKLESRIPFNEVGSVLILRSTNDDVPAGLYARIGDDMEAFELLSGPEDILKPIKARVVEDLKSARRTIKENRAWPSLATGEQGRKISMAQVSAS